MQLHQKGLYFLVMILSLFLVVTALGTGLFNTTHFIGLDWQHLVFSKLCHQDASRSFYINGQPMAVCARCFGIYMSFLLGWLLLPIVGLLIKSHKKRPINFISITILVNVIDVLGNYFGWWTNTESTRFAMGSFFGLFAAFIFMDDFFQHIPNNEVQYGNGYYE